MTINLTELRDEPLGKHPSHVYSCGYVICFVALTEAQQDVVAADDESSFTFDVDGLSDEPLDAPYKRTALVCLNVLCGAGTSPWG